MPGISLSPIELVRPSRLQIVSEEGRTTPVSGPAGRWPAQPGCANSGHPKGPLWADSNTKTRNKFQSSHSAISSGHARGPGGTVWPSCLAAFGLVTSTNLVGRQIAIPSDFAKVEMPVTGPQGWQS